MEYKYLTSTLICVNTSKEKILDLVDDFTIKGEIILLSSFNILDDSISETDSYFDMDKEKVNISDRLIVYGDASSADVYVNALVEYAKSLGKSIQFYTD